MSRTNRLSEAFAAEALSLPPEGDLVVLRAASPALAEELPRERLLFESSFKPVHDALAAAGLRVSVRAEAPAAMAVVTLGRAKAEALGDAARALALLPTGGVLALDGARTDGIDSLAKALGAVLPLEGSFSKAHGKVVWTRRPETLPPEVADWAAAAAPAPNAAGFVTAPGMFSPDAPDPGSIRLAEAIRGKISGRVADLGAGWGWLAVQALAGNPGLAAIDLFEAEARALAAAKINLPDPRASFHWSDVRMLRRIAPGYDAVISNPPFHQGRAAEPDLGAAFIGVAGRILKPGGRFFMVANRQLPYEAALDAAFARVERLAEDGAFKLFRADRPRKR
jgi:16S rRNA (guanine1207-N2)-methyltransferase